MLRVGDTAPASYTTKASKQDLRIEPEAAMVDVPHVEGEAFVPTNSIASVDLRPARDAGTDLMSAHLLLGIEVEIFHQQRPWANQSHFSAKHIPKLGEFIEAHAPEKGAQSRNAFGVRLRASCHGSKFQDRERFSIQPRSGLTEQNWDAHPAPNAQCNYQHERHGEDQSRRGNREIKGSLNRVA